MEDVKMEHHPFVRPVRKAAVSSAVEGMLGIGALTLSIIGLAHVVPVVLLAVSSIVVGTALLFEGGSIAARYSYYTSESERRRRGWAGAIFLGGASGVTFGILGLIGIFPLVLIPIAAMSMGVSLLMSSAVNARLNALEVARSKDRGLPPETARETMPVVFGVQAFAGLGAMGLGLLALASVNPVVLALVAMFSIGAAALMGGAIVTRVMSVFGREYDGEHFGGESSEKM
jgi:hypothetical protein